MKIIDKTPLIGEDGSISTLNRLKGTLQYGFSWYPDLLAQEKAIKIFEKHLGNKFTLIRNLTLGKSKITVPLILVGPPGVYVIFVTHLVGTYRAKGDAWGTISGGSFKEAGINLLKRTASFSKAVEVYLERKNFKAPNGISPVLLSVNPGLHIASVRPIVRIVMSDAAERFAASLAQEPPLINAETVHRLTENLLTPLTPPKPPKEPSKPKPRANEELDFALQEKTQPRPQKRPKKKSSNSYFGMTKKQLTILGVMAAVLVCLLVFFIIGVVFYFG
jgi:hypothetical protein